MQANRRQGRQQTDQKTDRQQADQTDKQTTFEETQYRDGIHGKMKTARARETQPEEMGTNSGKPVGRKLAGKIETERQGQAKQKEGDKDGQRQNSIKWKERQNQFET